MPVTDPSLLPWLTGPYAALVLALICMWGLFKLYQSERTERRENFKALQELTESIREVLEAARGPKKRR